MKLSIVELFNSLMGLEENFVVLYKNIAVIDGRSDLQLKNVASVLSRAETQHVMFYKNLIDQMAASETPILIEAELIEKARIYLLTFKASMKHSSLKSVNEILVMAIDYENKNAFILKQVLELLAAAEGDHEELIIVFEKLIQEEYKHANNLKLFLKYD